MQVLGYRASACALEIQERYDAMEIEIEATPNPESPDMIVVYRKSLPTYRTKAFSCRTAPLTTFFVYSVLCTSNSGGQRCRQLGVGFRASDGFAEVARSLEDCLVHRAKI